MPLQSPQLVSQQDHIPKSAHLLQLAQWLLMLDEQHHKLGKKYTF